MGGQSEPASWTAARTARLLELEKEGLSASEIAAALGGGITRASVIGKIHREVGRRTVVRGRSPKVGSGTAGPRREELPLKGEQLPGQREEPAKRADPPIFPADTRPAVFATRTAVAPSARPAKTTVVRLEDLRGDIAGGGRQCRYIADDPSGAGTLHCGATTTEPGKPYCPEHARLCYQQVDAPRRRLRA